MKPKPTPSSCLLIAALAVGSAYGQDDLSSTDSRYPALQEVVDTYFAQHQATSLFSGISAYVSPSAESPGLFVTTGSPSFQDEQPIRRHALWEVGSITKSFTSVLILKLEAKGLLDIHDNLGKWLPQYPDWSSITIEQLLNMTAPIDDYFTDTKWAAEFASNIHRTWTPAEQVSFEYSRTYEGDPWYYSNTNYVLASMIIEKATCLEKAGCMSYAEALQKMLLEPLRLRETYYQPRVPPDRILDAMVSAYQEAPCGALDLPEPCPSSPLWALKGEDLKTVNLTAYGATGGILMTLPDVARWARVLFSHTLLPPRQKAELFSLVSQHTGKHIPTTSLADRAGFSLGVGQNWDVKKATPLWYYQGETFGNNVMWGRLAGDDLIVVVAQNSDPENAQIFDLYPKLLDVLEP
jgi:D-alanyl-D-alanine carboxypeptidase